MAAAAASDQRKRSESHRSSITSMNDASEAGTDVVIAPRDTYQVQVKGEILHIDKRYQDLKFIRGGAYGFVCAAFDTVST